MLRLIARLNIGGPAIQAVTLTGDLPRDQFQTVLVYGRTGPGEGDMSYLAKEKCIRPVTILNLSREISFSKDLKALIAVMKILKDFKPHILHTHTAKAGTIGRLAAISINIRLAKQNRIRLVHTFHGHVFHSYFRALKTQIYIQIEKLLAKFTDCIIVVSKLQKKDICGRFRIADESKVRVIPLGFDLSVFEGCKNNRDTIRKKFFGKNNSNPFVVGIIGRLAPVKNHIMFLRAIEYLKAIGELEGFRFLIIGDGELKDALLEDAIKKNIKEYLVFAGWQKDMPNLYQGLDAVVLTSKNEGTPVALIEAMAAEKPIIATAVGGVPDLLGRILETTASHFKIAENGIMVPNDHYRALAYALTYLRKEHRIISMMTAHAKAFVLDCYSKERLLGDIKRLYTELISGGLEA